MKFIKQIREDKGLNFYQMAKLMGFSGVQSYQYFEDSKRAVNAKWLIKLWKVSGLSAKAFLEKIEQEVSTDNEKADKR